MFGNVSVLLCVVLCCVCGRADDVGRGVVACCWANRWTVDGLWFSSVLCALMSCATTPVRKYRVVYSILGAKTRFAAKVLLNRHGARCTDNNGPLRWACCPAFVGCAIVLSKSSSP